MSAIIVKEVRQYLTTVTGLLFAAVNLFVMGLYFLAGNLLSLNPSTAPVMSNVLFILMIMVPVLTMRILSEERKLKTDQLLFTSPLPVWKVVLGKYLAILVIFLIPVLVSDFFPLVLSLYGEVSIGESYTATLGYFLYGAACIAIGVFISSVTESQIIAAVLTFLALFATFLMGGIVDILTSGGNKLFDILLVLDFPSRIENIMSGILNTGDIFYYISIIALMLFLTVQSILKRRFTVSKNTVKFTVFSYGAIALAIAAVVLSNYLISLLPEEKTEIDVTGSRRFTVSEEAKEALENLSQPVTIYCIGTKDMLDAYDERELSNTLERFDALSKELTVIYKDPSKEPSFTEKYTDSSPGVGSLIVESGDRFRILNSYDIYESSVDYQTYSQIRTGYDGEGQIIGAIGFVSTGELPKIYCLSGHSEAELASYTALEKAITKNNMESADLNLMNVEAVPEDADALLILGPMTDYSGDDIEKLEKYLDGGGNAVIALNYTEEGTPALDALLEEYGVSHVNGIVMEGDEQYMYQTPMYLLPEVHECVLTEKLISARLLALIPESSAFRQKENTDEALSVTAALTTSDSSYAKMNVTGASTGNKEAGDEDGPFDIADYIKREKDGKITKLALFAADTLFSDMVNETVGGANVSMVSAALGDMIETEAVSADIPVKSLIGGHIAVPYGGALLWGLLFILIIPAALLIMGIVIWLKRRRL
ncbi:MAG: Gldg family protein [Lachnospiraceae bacterium]|nr:Gldg family protein [Lachnospiraceae bacterium]